MSVSINEIKSLHALLVASRNIAYSGDTQKELSGILDAAEYLVAIWIRESAGVIVGGKPNDQVFSEYVADLEKRHPSLKGITARLSGQ